MSTEHSPLPWRVSGDHPSRVDITPEFGYAVANLFLTPETEANAAFIVRACNAHDALTHYVELAVGRVELANAEGDPILSAWLPGARAALAKAQDV